MFVDGEPVVDAGALAALGVSPPPGKSWRPCEGGCHHNERDGPRRSEDGRDCWAEQGVPDGRERGATITPVSTAARAPRDELLKWIRERTTPAGDGAL